MKIESDIDHTFLKPHFDLNDWRIYQHELLRNAFRSACITPFMASEFSSELENYPKTVVFDFPYQQLTPYQRVRLVEVIVNELAIGEIDIVWCDYLFKKNKYLKCLEDLTAIRRVAERRSVKVKVIVESGYLTTRQLRVAYSIVSDSGALAIKTSTGFLPKKATLDTVKLWKDIGGNLAIKASGGIRDYKTALSFIEAGADIIGTSYGHQIVEEEQHADIS